MYVGRIVFTYSYILIFIILPVTSIVAPSQDVNFIEGIAEDFSAWDRKREQFLRYAKDYPYGWPKFDCMIPSKSRNPEDVHHLAPWHFSVIGAIGDSLTAGRAAGAEYFSDLVLDYRGLSFVTGGEKNLTHQASLFNIFSHFSPHLAGKSTGTAQASNISVAGLNLAKAGSLSDDLLRQAYALVQRIKSHPKVNFHNSWKFINIFIGSNDLCKGCRNETKSGVEEFAQNIRKTLIYLRNNLPRTYINLLPPFHIEILLETQDDNPFCVDLQRVYCPCLFQLRKQDLKATKRLYDSILTEFLTNDYQTEDFAVVISSGANVDQLATVGNIVNLAFVGLDCFHFSQIAHDMVAKIIWHDIFKPIDARSAVDLNQFQPQRWFCPSEDCPYLRTSLNSRACKNDASFSQAERKRGVKYENTVYLPPMSELERRAFMEEHGVVFILSFLGVIFAIGIACLALSSCRRTDRSAQESSERTYLLNDKHFV
ncbi:hypothetical protein RB195_020123 [Necator americanus]|uniref:GDSL-like protein n=1 Tax=Necator americanus TaxID=51031 RepID=A0ABR1CIR4_NECAM